MNRPLANTARRAFTLVELLVVIFIIGGLIALLVPAIAKVQRAAKGAATSAQLAAIATSIQSYYSDFRAYPGPLPNNVLGGAFYKTAVAAGIADYVTNTTTPYSYSAFTDTLPNHDYEEDELVTGSENLVLGLLGGLELETVGGVISTKICYDPNALFPGGASTPNAIGAENLNVNQPKRFASYLQTKPGDVTPQIITPSINDGSMFTDAAQRICNDTRIPEFLDKYSQPMPILYLRTNPGAIGVVARAGATDAGGAVLDTNNNAVTTQYDLAQVLGYTQAPKTMSSGAIGTTYTDPTKNHHGLQGIGVTTDTIATGWANATNPGYNGLAYLRDPNAPGTPDAPDYTKTPPSLSAARQKDGFLLISAGPDGIYGTADDVIYPGTLNP